jgi:hypothetical protein
LTTTQDPGNGRKRIGSPLSLREDFYALLYVANVRDSMQRVVRENFDKRQAALE